MHGRHRNHSWSILFVLGVLVLLVSSCAPVPAPVPPGPTSTKPAETPPPELPSPMPTGTSAPEPPEAMPLPGANCSILNAPTKDFTTGSHFILDQVILTGPKAQFENNEDTWRKELDGQEIALIPLVTCDLGIPGPGTAEDLAGALSEFAHPDDRSLQSPFQNLPDRESRPIEARLYQVDIGQRDLTFVEALPLIAQTTSSTTEGEVFTDPNYLVGPLESGTPCADPTQTEANPFTVGGSPFTVGGSTGAPSGAEASPDIFWEQWALREIGVTMPDGKDPAPGDGVTVAVFDTSPFPEVSTAYSEWIDTVFPPFNLHLRFPALSNSLNPRPAKSQDVSNHGFFAVGLVHAVAPGSDIYLIRILNEYGCGDLFALTNAIADFMGFTTPTQELPETEWQKQVVLSLSLGVQQPDPVELSAYEWPEEIYSLSEVVHKAVERGAVLVAAAGNESIPTRPAARMQLPAAYPDVIGVAASTQDKTAACYTNNGDVGAPGADGIACTDGCPCVPLATSCSLTDGDCPWGLVSLSRASSTGYQFWVGTSFATPLVSGQAARLMSQPSALSTPSSVIGSILSQAVPPPVPQSQLGQGIIEVTNSATP